MKIVGFTLLSILFLSGCGSSSNSPTPQTGSSDPGPLDGSYTMTAWTCNSKNVFTFLTSGPVTSVVLSVNGTSGTTTVSYSNQCTRMQPFAASYPASQTATLVESAPTCPSGCSLYCSGYQSAASTYTYTLTTTLLTTTRVLTTEYINQNDVLKAIGCSPGSTETRVFSR